MEAASIRAVKYVDSQLQARKVESLSLLPKEIRRQIKAEARRLATEDVFGVGHKVAKDGTPIEQGMGSAGNMTQQSIDAYVKYQTDKRFREKPEEGFEENLKRMKAQLAECNARRRAEADDDDDD